MKVFFDFKKVKQLKRPVVALGVFDGVHQGHRRIISAAVKKAKTTGGRSVVVTFCPHPQKEESLYSLSHRLKIIESLGVEACIVIKFNRAFAAITAEDFIKKIIAAKIGAKYVYVGKNFRFGRRAKGGLKLLRELSGIYGFRIKAFDVVKTARLPISSTYIRKLIKAGELRKAERLLVHPVCILGTVIRGASLARKLGFPTANIDPHHEVLPPSGVYAVRVILKNKIYKGVCSIGTKPTLTGKNIQHIEVHIFSLRSDIYGEYLEIQFIQKIRDQKKFRSLPALAQKIKKDVIQAKRMFFSPQIRHKL